MRSTCRCPLVCMHQPMTSGDMVFDSVTWPFILEGISKNQYFLCIFAAILSYQFDNGSIGISRRVILAVATNLTLSCREPASVHRAATKAEPKAMKSCWAAVLLES